MKIRSVVLMFALVAVSASTGVSARHAGGFVDYARVISATPVYETVDVAVPVEECWTERVVHRPGYHRPHAGALAGGIIGGVLGNQVGDGRGRTAATVAGTLLGASIGRELAHQGHGRPYVTRERHCEWVDRYETEERLVGYRVEYRYEGQTFVTHTDEHPGRRIAVRVDVEPIDRY